MPLRLFSLGRRGFWPIKTALEAVEDQRPKEKGEEPAANDFIRKSFRPAVGFRSVSAAREPREEVSRTRRRYISPGGQLTAREETCKASGRFTHIYPPGDSTCTTRVDGFGRMVKPAGHRETATILLLVVQSGKSRTAGQPRCVGV